MTPRERRLLRKRVKVWNAHKKPAEKLFGSFLKFMSDIETAVRVQKKATKLGLHRELNRALNNLFVKETYIQERKLTERALDNINKRTKNERIFISVRNP